MQQPQGQQPPPPKKMRRWPWILLGIGMCLFGICAICGLIALLGPIHLQIGPALGPIHLHTGATYSGVWTTTQTFTGSGEKGTPIFALASNDWRLIWNCSPGSNGFGAFNFMVTAYDATNTSVRKLVINEICKPGNTQGSTEVHDDLGGDIYLDISASGSYTLKVQDLE